MKYLTIIATVAALALGGCVSMGTNFDAAAVEQIAPGTPMSAVIARLGQPNNRTTMADGQTMLMWMHSTGTALGTGSSRVAGLLFDAQGKFVRVVSQSQTQIN